jgi:hypothetical protein
MNLSPHRLPVPKVAVNSGVWIPSIAPKKLRGRGTCLLGGQAMASLTVRGEGCATLARGLLLFLPQTPHEVNSVTVTIRPISHYG